MSNEHLIQGIEILCKNDSEIESLITPRKDEILSLLERYINEIELFNPAYGLVGTNNTEELVIKHILDSLAPLGLISRLFSPLSSAKSVPCAHPFQFHAADAGSGAGLPGIPLAIALPFCEVSLIERMGRRAGFLFNTKAALSLSNITIEESELEKIKNKQYNLVTFRAFKPLEPKLLRTLFNICAPNGVIAAYKGKREKIEAEMAALLAALPITEIQWEAIPYNVPFLDEERHILVISHK